MAEMNIVTSEQMKNIDRRTTDRFGIPSIVLMENAALAVVDALFEHYPRCEKAAIFCGVGQNGGDGLAIARHLENRGVVPAVFIVGDRKRYPAAMRRRTFASASSCPSRSMT
jgi:hydroxyethylthiazole kinase-like uncharacterized protein yjeF